MLNHYSATLNFEYLKNIGSEGKNSQVHIAHDKQLDAEIVVKEIKKASFKDEAAFFNEAKILYSSDHPNIVPIQYSCYDDAFCNGQRYVFVCLFWFFNTFLLASFNLSVSLSRTHTHTQSEQREISR